jgi:dethiobiotin synthetase
MRTLYITATNTDIGKTYTSIKLIDAFASLGYRVGVMKPIETGVETHPLDATLLLTEAKKVNPDFISIEIQDICPYQFKLPAAPFVAKKETIIKLDRLKKAQQKLSNYCDILLIESAGGLMTPIDKSLFMVDLIALFKAQVLLITDDQLGCINNTLLNMHLLKDDFIWCVNQKSTDGSFQQISLPYFQSRFGKVLTVQKDIQEIANSLLSLSQE